MSDKQFFGWQIGSNLTPHEADLLEPMVDVMIEMLQEALLLPPEWDRQKSQHEIALHLMRGLGEATNDINDISMLLVTEQNPDEQLLQLNARATQLRKRWLAVAVMATKAIINLDQQLNGDTDDTDKDV